MMEWTVSESDLRIALRVLLAALALVAAGVGALVLATPFGAPVARLLDGVFAWSSTQAMWYVTRAAGLIAYLLLWLSTAWGLTVSGKTLDPAMPRGFTFDAHEYLSLLALGFTALHGGVLLLDRYLPFTLTHVLVPFASPYRPVWVGIGVIAFYLSLLVSVTFYLRRWIGAAAFRWIHLTSYLGFAAAAAHSWLAGTDTALPVTQWIYAASILVIVFLTVHRVTAALLARLSAVRAR
jgi:predicted ferric reductase